MSEPVEHHEISIEFESGEYPQVTFVCTAPEGAACRMVPKCMTDSGRCFEHEGHHHPDCDPATDRGRVDQGSCNVKNWIDIDPAIMGEGKVSLAVTTEWTGDDWIFHPTGDQRLGGGA